ncbi:hypothetical protein QBC45DRAFT_442372, partial [Copromyces sp. CBS 386.78]
PLHRQHRSTTSIDPILHRSPLRVTTSNIDGLYCYQRLHPLNCLYLLGIVHICALSIFSNLQYKTTIINRP